MMEIQRYILELTVTKCVAIVVAFGLAWLLAGIVYNTFWHPLANIPGPVFARISGIPSYYYATRGDRHLWLQHLHETYGPKFRINPNTVIFANPKAYIDIYTKKANVQRSSFYPALQKSAREENTLTVTDPDLHARKRKMLNLIFTERSLGAASEFMIKHIDRWGELLVDGSTDWSPSKDATVLTDALFFDIMTDLCFGKSAEIKEPGENPLKRIPHCSDEYLQFIYPITRSPVLDSWLWLRPKGLDTFFNSMAPQAVKDYYKFVEDCLTDRLKRYEEKQDKQHSGQRQDMLHFLLEAEDPDTGGPAYNAAELFGEAVLLIITGASTVATAMSGFFFYITRDAKRYQKLIREIRITFDSAEDITPGPKLSGCTYLRACIEEAIRLAPPSPSEHARKVRSGGTVIDGDFYPAGVIVGAAPWVTLRNESIFKDASKFHPERFIVDTTSGISEADVSRTRSAYHPFATGPNSCPGKNMAYQQFFLTLARTLHRYDVRKTPGSTLGEGSANGSWGRKDPGTFQLRDAYVSIRAGPMVQFRRRSDVEI